MEAVNKNIKSIMNPKSIAVVGATNRPGSVGLAVFRNILTAGFQGVLYPVNPKAKYVQSVKAYPKLEDIPDEVDLAVIIVPAKIVCPILEEAGQKKVKGGVVITAGFKEIGGHGVELENSVKEVIAKYDICLIGPNCLGVINNSDKVRMNASFATKMPKAGNIAFISQSGALCTAVLDYAEGRNIGFSKFVSFGNKADVNEIDLLRYLKDDPDTEVILMYLEDITNGRAFLETAREITWQAHKPILAVKSGRSIEGARAAASHTGALVGSDTSYDALFRQSGILRVESVDELFNQAIAFSKQPIPKGNRIAIVTNAGGPGIMATDAAIRHNLKIAPLSDETKQKLKEELPPTASVENPVDVIGDANHERYKAAIRHILMDDNVDGAIVILSPQAMINVLETAQILPPVVKDINKPVLCSFMGIVDVSEGVKYLEKHGIPNYQFPEAAVRSMASMAFYSKILNLDRRKVRRVAADRDTANAIIKKKLADKDKYYMSEREANEILQSYGFPVLTSFLLKDSSEVEEAAEHIIFPAAMKISSRDIVHKFDVGGVQLKIKTKEEAQKAFEQMIENVKRHKPSAKIDGVIIERMAKRGVEVILGGARDPKFGPICMFGLGGTLVEAMKDITFRLAPMWEISAEIMIQSIKAYIILKGIRGAPPCDIDAIKDCILRLSQMLSDHPEIAELDINPLIVYPEGEGCVVADSRILLKKAT
ncbi:MAG: CoA-binding protein [Phycisphaerae bacterium]|nr:CoA-binding protein [Phycisphaerae bacterium]NIP51238.1 CoA-binding protein [Phycisphaerae bacterium]NIS50444.1 CoA-binding protein [Phycisphaerae bacterium]NIU08179.1 CoA-binding protein [Phycisphaerae bacterium]NIU54950.1 CoA-binding protein [Phycisphaerae bacterium]